MPGVTTTGALAVIGLVAVVLALGYAVSYNRFVRHRQEVADAWATIDAELARRHDLVPRLIEAVRGAAAHERSLLVDLAERHATAVAAPHTIAAANTWEPPLAAAVHRVVALRERYPQLNGQRNFLALQAELTTTEDRIAAARRYHNSRVERLNRRVEAFPSTLVARAHRIGKAPFAEV